MKTNLNPDPYGIGKKSGSGSVKNVCGSPHTLRAVDGGEVRPSKSQRLDRSRATVPLPAEPIPGAAASVQASKVAGGSRRGGYRYLTRKLRGGDASDA